MTQPIDISGFSHQPPQCWHKGHRNEVVMVAEMEATHEAIRMDPQGLVSYSHQQLFDLTAIVQSPQDGTIR